MQKELLPQLNSHQDEWLGFRPTLPDFLPVIGPSKKIKILFIHLTSPFRLDTWCGNWKIVAGVLANEKTNLDLPLHILTRFS